MNESKIEIKIGLLTFSGQGDQEWLSKQLDKILAQAEKLVHLAPPPGSGPDTSAPGTDRRIVGKDPALSRKTLPAFLQEKNATRNQTKKFLATAVWLEGKGQNRLQTSDVTKALKDASQTRLGNPADCLNKNVTKGYCEKDGKQFFVTGDGKISL